MKIRDGFVSNSSASGFIVIRQEFLNFKKILLTKKQEKLLLNYGFKKTPFFYSDQIEDENVEMRDNELYNYGYHVDCNQDDVILFLLTHNIPFEATCYYGHETYIYKKESKYFLQIENYGKQATMLGDDDDYKEIMAQNYSAPITKINVKQWIKENRRKI